MELKTYAENNIKKMEDKFISFSANVETIIKKTCTLNARYSIEVDKY